MEFQVIHFETCQKKNLNKNVYLANFTTVYVIYVNWYKNLFISGGRDKNCNVKSVFQGKCSYCINLIMPEKNEEKISSKDLNELKIWSKWEYVR